MGKAAAEKLEENQATAERETVEEETEEEASEEDSPVKPAYNNRAARVGMPPEIARKALFRDLNEELSNMSEEATKEWGQGIFKALKAKSAKSDDSPIVMGKIWSKINGGISTNVDAIMDSGCTHPLTTMSVTEAIKMKVTPLSRDLVIVEASGKNLRILGTVRMFLEADVLGGRKLVEAAVIQGEGSKEVLVSLGLMKSWDLIHQSFPS